MPTVPDHPASSHVWCGTTRVGVECLGSTSAGAMRRTRTAVPRVSPIMQPINSVGYERYWSARKRRAWSDRISRRTIGAPAIPLPLRAHADSTSRADSGCRASNAVRPSAETTMRMIRLRPSLTAPSLLCAEPAAGCHGLQDRCQPAMSNSGANTTRRAAFWGVALLRLVCKTEELEKNRDSGNGRVLRRHVSRSPQRTPSASPPWRLPRLLTYRLPAMTPVRVDLVVLSTRVRHGRRDGVGLGLPQRR